MLFLLLPIAPFLTISICYNPQSIRDYVSLFHLYTIIPFLIFVYDHLPWVISRPHIFYTRSIFFLILSMIIYQGLSHIHTPSIPYATMSIYVYHIRLPHQIIYILYALYVYLSLSYNNCWSTEGNDHHSMIYKSSTKSLFHNSPNLHRLSDVYIEQLGEKRKTSKHVY